MVWPASHESLLDAWKLDLFLPFLSLLREGIRQGRHKWGVPGVRLWPFSLFPSCFCLRQSQAPVLQVVPQMAQQQTPSWADWTHRVFVFVFDSQDREQENCFHWDQPQLFLQKQLVELLCCFWSHYAMKWSLDEGQMYYLGRNPGSSSRKCSVKCQQMKLLSRVLFMQRLFWGEKKPLWH